MTPPGGSIQRNAVAKVPRKRRLVTTIWLTPEEEDAIRTSGSLIGMDQIAVYARFAALLVAGERELAIRSVPVSALARAQRLSLLRRLLR